MTTPRVTVPVEPTEAMLDAWHKAVEAGIFSQTPNPDYMREAYRAMLSAAPAPEGGVADARAVAKILNPALFSHDKAEAHRAASPHSVSGARTDAVDAARAVLNAAALATREEAPAEEGEPCEHQPGCDCTVAEEDVARSKPPLSAQPQAREDAQPVAWLVGGGGGTIMTRAAAWAAGRRDQGVSVTPLFTHPAPDALRVALEALEKAARAISAQYALAQAEYQHLDTVASKHDKIVQEGRRAIREALAVLQAEQGAK